ncbi:MAG: FeS cluster assembly scaffold IscU [Candidatus Entotheonella factor]|uniref:FeS cluster assembly scaffold IscU n=1 Tax=Entotheonella factor TaxID=1429438 RepID=W4M0V5_ENTF1|nr:iron-sulfur cluster assembly scaffold protein [Candidatus Entotheonella palauensis]ETX03277.1 MAG: FeS cluster assembly scaffold IscU [Candidatus Entotheonella factor]
MYSDVVQDHFEHPRNVGVLEHADAEAEVMNPACGDIMRLYVRVDGDRIVEATFQTQGCPAAIAAGSITTEMLVDMTLEDAAGLKRDAVNDALGGLPPQKVHSSVLVEDAVKAVLADYRKRQSN